MHDLEFRFTFSGAGVYVLGFQSFLLFDCAIADFLLYARHGTTSWGFVYRSMQLRSLRNVSYEHMHGLNVF